jgi:tRNA-splicing ligase RtcB
MPIATSFKNEGSALVKIWTKDIEASALQQLHDMATLPFIHKHIAVMPDVHWGMGSTVGSVIPTIRAIVPAAVGVDIGCGMVAAKLNIRPDQLPDSLYEVRTALEAAIPHGRTDNGAAADRGAWGKVPTDVITQWDRLKEDSRLAEVKAKHGKLFTQDSGARQLGTLGTGNHFVELCLDKDNGVWLMLHSGSRGTGNRIGSYFITKAKELMERYYIKLPNADLAYIPEAEPLFGDYWKALSWAQDYAQTNRALMLQNAMAALSFELGMPIHGQTEAVNCHHNYVSKEKHYGEQVYVTRKGAVRVERGGSGSSPVPWARRASSCVGWAIRKRLTPARTAPAGA